MDRTLKRIAITTPDITTDESLVIRRILERGWDMVHLRHPNASLTDMRNLIESIPQKLHSKLRLHGHFALLNEFNLGGIHLNKRCPVLPLNYRGKYSRSCHSVDEIASCGDCDYVTLSPVFDSISKKGYAGKFATLAIPEEISDSHDVIALGGVTPEKIPNIRSNNYAGYAVLGALMYAEDKNSVLDKFHK